MSGFVEVVGWFTIVASVLISIASLYIFALDLLWRAFQARHSWAEIKTAFRFYRKHHPKESTDER